MTVRPFLFRYRVDVTPRKISRSTIVKYDEALDMLLVMEKGRYIPAIDASADHSLDTRKADLEKGQDQKDDF